MFGEAALFWGGVGSGSNGGSIIPGLSFSSVQHALIKLPIYKERLEFEGKKQIQCTSVDWQSAIGYRSVTRGGRVVKDQGLAPRRAEVAS